MAVYVYASNAPATRLRGCASMSRAERSAISEASPTEKQARGFAIDPAGKYIVVAGEKSDAISVYAIQSDGAPVFLARYPAGKGPNWVEIVATAGAVLAAKRLKRSSWRPPGPSR
jgi:6-phosphogluconolactonase